MSILCCCCCRLFLFSARTYMYFYKTLSLALHIYYTSSLSFPPSSLRYAARAIIRFEANFMNSVIFPYRLRHTHFFVCFNPLLRTIFFRCRIRSAFLHILNVFESMSYRYEGRAGEQFPVLSPEND